MTNEHLPVTTMFREMVSQGHISPVDHMENLRLPGEFVAVPSITTYGTPDMPIRTGTVGCLFFYGWAFSAHPLATWGLC